MKEIYSTYEAKAKLSEILRQVRVEKTIRISNRGVPIAEIRPIGKEAARLAEHLEELTQPAALVRRRGERPRLQPIAKVPGALRRFLEERDE